MKRTIAAAAFALCLAGFGGFASVAVAHAGTR